MINLQSLENTFQAITTETVVLTPNRRLTATLKKLFAEKQSEQQSAWVSPDILPITTWLQRWWHEVSLLTCEENQYCLSPTQESFLWEKVLKTTELKLPILQIAETAEIVKSAYQLLIQWCIDSKDPVFQLSEEYISLQKWMHNFEQLCKRNNWLDNTLLPKKLIELIQHNKITAPKHIILYGFTEIAPLFQKIFTLCESQGTLVEATNITKPAQSQHSIKLGDTEEEISTVARYAKAIHENEPHARIGCVFPTLENNREIIAKHFAAVFSKENALSIDVQDAPYNISGGKKLAQYRLINTALQILNMQTNSVTRENFSLILTTPFIGDAETEFFKRAEFDRLLRQNNLSRFKLSSIINPQLHMKIALNSFCPLLTKRLTSFLNLIDKVSDKKTFFAWAEIFNRLLTIMGWPGERSINSEEYQVANSWMKLLNDFQTLDQVADKINYSSAISILTGMANRSLFQPQTPDAPIQVLGVLEAAGIPFDYLWIAGMDDVNWPPPPKPNPFIPKSLQREKQMPHATAERELYFCRTLLAQFKSSSPSVIFSYAALIDKLIVGKSPLIRDISEISNVNLASYLPKSEHIFQTRKIEYLTDDKAPTVTATERIYGGVSVIKQQSICPFKAFAEWRLHARELEKTLPGLRAKDRGSLIHKALEIIWSTLQHQERLLQLSDIELQSMVANAIDKSIATTIFSHRDDENYLSLERKRLHKLLLHWLEFEKRRNPFSIAQQEATAQIKLNNLNLTTRIDRIDQLPNGKQLIIDYKTGKYNEINTWFSERPEEPQLPLYTYMNSSNIAGITFAQIYPGAYEFKGVSDNDLEIKGIKNISEVKKATVKSWNEQLLEWQRILAQLSDDFYLGKANVDPKDAAQTCQWCALKPLCRISENNIHE